MKKLLPLLLAVVLSAGVLASCAPTRSNEDTTDTNTTAAESTGTADSAETTGEAEKTGFTLYYPSYMQKDFGEKLELAKKPEKIIVLSNSALQIMVRCGVKPIASTKPTSSVAYPDWVKDLPVISTGMSKLDVEAVIAMQPDLLIMGAHLKEKFAPQLEAANIPLYYTSEGPSITYNEVKEEAIALTRSFGSEAEVEKVKGEFEAVEKRAADFKLGSKAMILFGAPPSFQQTSKGYLGSILNLLSFENISDTIINPEMRTAPLDMEKLVSLNPGIIFAISPTCPTAENIQGIYEEEFGKNPEIWDMLDAVKNDNVIYLSSEYVTSKGIHIINSINSLMDLLETKLG